MATRLSNKLGRKDYRQDYIANCRQYTLTYGNATMGLKWKKKKKKEESGKNSEIGLTALDLHQLL